MSVRAPKWSRRSIDGHSTAASMCSGVGVASSSAVLSSYQCLSIPVGLCWAKGHCCLVPACQAVRAVDLYRSQHAERQASDKNRSVGGRRSPWPACVRIAGPCERRALTLVAEALRALSGLGCCSLGSWAKILGPWAPIETTLLRRKQGGRRRTWWHGRTVHCEMCAHYKASVKRRQLWGSFRSIGQLVVKSELFQRKTIALSFVFSHWQKCVDQLARRERTVNLPRLGRLDVFSM